jgi:multidrug efflux pump
LIVSQMLTLYTTPVIYLFFDRLARRFSHEPEKEQAGDKRPEVEPAPA